MIDGELTAEPIAGPDANAGARDCADDDGEDIDNEKVLTDLAVEGQLQLGSLGVLPELAGLPEREAAYARAARAKSTLPSTASTGRLSLCVLKMQDFSKAGKFPSMHLDPPPDIG